jgi:signal transduction histidine kinase
MRSLYLRIWLTVVLALALFALASGWLWQRQLEQQRARFESAASERVAAWGELVQRSLPGLDEPEQEQAEALLEWSTRLRLPMALDDVNGRRIATSERFERREAEGGPPPIAVKLDDGRTLWVARRGPRRSPFGGGRDADGRARPAFAPPVAFVFGNSPVGPVLLLGGLFVAVAAGAYPVVRRLTRRLEGLKQGVEAFGAGALDRRVDDSGRDEVAAVGSTFNRAADRIESLVRSHQSLLANASHELRSPLARLKMAVSLVDSAEGEQREKLRREIEHNVAELDGLVEEVLLASRLDANAAFEADEPVELLPLAAEEAARVGAEAGGDPVVVRGSERLLRRALRNLLENARRYGQREVDVTVEGDLAGGGVGWRVCDRGPGVPAEYRERIFEPFFRLPGHAEREGGVGLGLSLVRQIAERHGGRVRCEPRAGGGTCFVVTLPGARRVGEAASAVPEGRPQGAARPIPSPGRVKNLGSGPSVP